MVGRSANLSWQGMTFVLQNSQTTVNRPPSYSLKLWVPFTLLGLAVEYRSTGNLEGENNE